MKKILFIALFLAASCGSNGNQPPCAEGGEGTSTSSFTYSVSRYSLDIEPRKLCGFSGNTTSIESACSEIKYEIEQRDNCSVCADDMYVDLGCGETLLGSEVGISKFCDNSSRYIDSATATTFSCD